MRVSKSSYIPLDVMSDYSIGESIATIQALVEKAKSLNLKALALTDRTLSGATEFYQTCVANNIKPIIGQKIVVSKKQLILLCKDSKAYKTLCLHSLDFQTPLKDFPLSKAECSHFICITPLCDSKLKAAFGNNLYKQIDFSESKKNLELLEKQENVKAVITNPVRYIQKDDAQALAILKKHLHKSAKNCSDKHFASVSEILPLLKQPNRLDLIKTTNFIAEQIQDIFPKDYFTSQNAHNRMAENLPNFKNAKTQLQKLVEKGFEKKQNSFENVSKAKKRLECELTDIFSHNWEKFFLFHHELAAWCEKNGIARSPGRGAAPSSFVSYLLGITNVNPLKYGLLYERFLNPEWLHYPDFDIDYDNKRLEDAINHLKEKYGEDHIARISVYETIRPEKALLIAARSLGVSDKRVTPITKIISCFLRTSINHFIDENNSPCIPVLSKKDATTIKKFFKNKKYKRLINIALKLERIKIGRGLHSSGFIVTEKPVANYISIIKDKNTGVLCAASTFIALDHFGLSKIDMLGLEELSKLKSISNAVAKRLEKNFDYKTIPLDDKKVLEAFSKGKTADVFQFDSPGMKMILKAFQPEKFSDLVLLNALYRPGPADYIPTVIEHKHYGIGDFYSTLKRESILNETYGIPAYQEQIMQIAHNLAGYTYREADMLRRALGRKKTDVVKAKKKEFMQRTLLKGIVKSKKQAERVFDILLTFSAIAFNKSHAVSYTLMGYWDMYLKIHYPEEYRQYKK